MLTVEQRLTVEERLAKLERTAKRWRLAALGLAGCVVCVVGMGADGDAFPKVLRTNLLIIEDENGRRGGAIGYAKPGDEIFLGLKGRDGNSYTSIKPGVEYIHIVKPDGKTSAIE